MIAGAEKKMVANVNKDPLDFFFKVPFGFSVGSSCRDAWLIHSSIGTHPKDRHPRACPEKNPQAEFKKGEEKRKKKKRNKEKERVVIAGAEKMKIMIRGIPGMGKVPRRGNPGEQS